MMDDDASPLLNDCLISDAYKIPGSPGLPNVFLLDVMSEFNSDFSLTDFKPMYVGGGGHQANSNEIPLDISHHYDRSDNTKDHCYISESQTSSINKGIHPKSFVKLESEDTYCSSSLPLTRVHKEICVKTEVYTVKPTTTLVVSNVPSQNLTVLTRQRSDDWSQASESPGALSPDDYSDSSNGGSEYFTPSPAPSTILSNGCRSTTTNVNFSVRTRSKMQELALQQNLITNQDLKSNGQLQLSPEERRTLMQEGYNVPTCLPLTKKDEEALKLVRRKIKNKLSAQESRRRRKEYIDTLEKRLHNFQTENNNLKRRLENLETNNQNLIGQLRKLQSTIGRSANQIPTPSAGVTLTAFLLLFAVLMPTFPVWSQVSFLVKGHRQMSLEVDLQPSGEHFHHGPSRVLSANECDVPYSAGYFHELIRSKDGCEEFPLPIEKNFHPTPSSVDAIKLSRDYSNSDPSPSLVDGGSGFNNLSGGGDVAKSTDGQISTKNSNCIGLACHKAAVLTDS